jgi:hypothetical protein
VTGFQPIGRRAVEHESALERDFVTLTTFRDPGAEIVSQPVTINFEHTGGERRYTPDFLVRWSSGGADLVEIKYWADLRSQWVRLRPAFVAARVWAREHDARFRIVSERRIRGSELTNAKRLLPLRSAPLDTEACELVLNAVRTLVTPTLGELVAAGPLDRATALSTVWRMMARGLLRADLTEVVQIDAPVWAP